MKFSLPNLKSINQKYLLALPFVLGLVILAASLIIAKIPQTRPRSTGQITSGVASKTASDYQEVERNITYHITTSQLFLNQARSLAKNNQQTDEDKKKIIETINQALDLANQAIALYPYDDRGFVQRANIYIALIPFIPSSSELAVQDLKEATRLNGQNPQYYSKLADIYLSAGDFENAALSFYNFHLLSPTDTQIIYNLADTLEKSGQLQKANYYFEKLISLLPPNDQTIEAIKGRKTHNETLLTSANLQYLSDPNNPVGLGPNAPPGSGLNAPQNTTREIIGTQELPLEQASVKGKVVIASGEKTIPTEKQTSEISVNAKTGQGLIPAGQKEVTINNKNVTSNKQIVIVPIGTTQNKVLRLVARKAAGEGLALSDPELVEGESNGWFKAGIDSPINTDIRFDWWIVD